MEIKLRDFESQLHFFNGMYKLPIGPYPTTIKVVEHEAARKPFMLQTVDPGKDYLIRRIQDFMSILRKEVNEGDDIINKLKLGAHEVEDKMVPYTELDFLTDMADWLADIQVYCGSEMVKFGLPQKETLKIVMSSNFSKLGADGKPIYDTEGKVQKGPMYWKPEPQIKALLQEKISEATIKPEPGIVWNNTLPPEEK